MWLVLKLGEIQMPELCRFLGIIIRMYAGDHVPPHFHVRYNGFNATVDIATAGITQGTLPPRIAGLVVEWALIHKAELLHNWELASAGKSLKKIKPL